MYKHEHRSVCVSEIRSKLAALSDHDFDELRSHVKGLMLCEGDPITYAWLGRLWDYVVDEHDERVKLCYKKLREDIPYPSQRR